MAVDKYEALPRETTAIANPNDLVVRLIECDDTKVQRRNPDGTTRMATISVPVKIHKIGVLKEKLIGVKYFKTLLEGQKFVESGSNSVDLLGDSPTAMKLLLQLLHGMWDPETHKVSILTIWELLSAVDKYGKFGNGDIDIRELGHGWFGAWYAERRKKNLNYEDNQMLLLPTYVFDHAEGFNAVTKHLVYWSNVHIMEKRPKTFRLDNLRLHQGVIQQLNAAKGRLKTILTRGLWEPFRKLLHAKCACKELVTFTFMNALAKTEVWPVDINGQKLSMSDMLAKLERFQGENPGDVDCNDYCNFDFQEVVTTASEKVEKYFDGLCLDCLNQSKLADENEDYWNHDKPGVSYDRGCRVRHGEPTWYYSFMGRREKMMDRNRESHGPYSSLG